MTTPVALVTGASGRIGAAIAECLHQQGYNVIIHYRRNQQGAYQLAEHLNQGRKHSAIIIQADLCNLESLQMLAEQSLQAWGQINLLVNNASAFYPTDIDDKLINEWNDLMNSNVRAPFLLSQHLLPALRTVRGQIINLVDIYSQRPLANHSIYSMSKAALAMMTQALAKDLAPAIRVNGISPGAILWPEETPTADSQKQLLQKIPLARKGCEADICQALLYLIKADYVTGQILNIDGGRSLNM